MTDVSKSVPVEALSVEEKTMQHQSETVGKKKKNQSKKNPTPVPDEPVRKAETTPENPVEKNSSNDKDAPRDKASSSEKNGARAQSNGPTNLKRSKVTWSNSTTQPIVEEPPQDPAIVKVQQYESDFPSLGETSQWSEKQIKTILQQDSHKKPTNLVNNQTPAVSSTTAKQSNGPSTMNGTASVPHSHNNTNHHGNNHYGGGYYRGNGPRRFNNYNNNNNYDYHQRNAMPNKQYPPPRAGQVSSRFYSSWDASEISGEEDWNSLGNHQPTVGPGGDGPSTAALRYYVNETKVRHATSVVSSWLYDMMCEELEEEAKYESERRSLVASDTSTMLSQVLEQLQHAYNAHNIAYDISDFKEFTRNRYAYPAAYLEDKFLISRATLLDVLAHSDGDLVYDRGLVRRSAPLGLMERLMLQWNPSAVDIPFLREERPNILKELLEFYFSPEGLPESDSLGRLLLENSGKITVEQLLCHPKLNRLRASRDEVLHALQGNRFVSVQDAKFIRLNEPLSDETIEAIKNFQSRPRPGTSLGGTLSGTLSGGATPCSEMLPALNTYPTWHVPEAMISPVESYYSMGMPLGDPTAFGYSNNMTPFFPVPPAGPDSGVSFLPGNDTVTTAAPTGQPSTTSTLATSTLPASAGVPVVGMPIPQSGSKSGNRTRNPSNVSALGDENARPDDIFISLDSEVDEGLGDMGGSTLSGAAGMGTKRFAIPERILAKHPSGDRHSTFGKTRMRNTKRGAKQDTKEAIAAALAVGIQLYDEEEEENEDDDTSCSGTESQSSRGRHKSATHTSLLSVLPPPTTTVPASKVNVVDPKTFEEYSVSRRARSVSAEGSRNRFFSGERAQNAPTNVREADPSRIPSTRSARDSLSKDAQSLKLMKNGEVESSASMQVPPAPPVAPPGISPYSHLGYQLRVNPLLPISLSPWDGHWHYIISLDQYLCGNAAWLERPDLLPVVDDYLTRPLYDVQQTSQPPKDVEFAHALDALKRTTEQHTETAVTSLPTTVVGQKMSTVPANKVQSVHPLKIDRGDGHAFRNKMAAGKPADTFVYKPRARTASGTLMEMGSIHNKGKIYYDELLEGGLKERTVKGIGKSQMMNWYYNIVRAILYVRFNRKIYESFKQYALEDDQHGARYGIQCLFYFYSYFLEQHFRNDLYMDFEHLVSEDVRNGKWYGCEKFWAFFHFSGKNPSTYVKDQMLLQKLQQYNTKEKYRAVMEVPHRFRIENH